MQLSSAGSRDPDGEIATYHWTFGDGTAGSSQPNPSHVYQSAGQYHAVLRVRDNGGAVSFDAVRVQVGAPPVSSRE